MNSYEAQLNELFASSSDASTVLAQILQNFACATGTIHIIDRASGLLKLYAHQGIPPFVLEKIQLIPVGKGIAGCAAERKAPVQLCNLQENLGGIAKPDAQKTNVQGALAVPIMDAQGLVVGVVGIGKMQPYDFSVEEIGALQKIAQRLLTILSI
jgi:L-methionine (R)-S-oxide reductase